MTCERCGANVGVWSTSFMNTDKCCTPCLEDEKTCPGYAAAKEAEERAVRGGNYNYRGVGLKRDDVAHLIGKLATRSYNEDARRLTEAKVVSSKPVTN